MPAGTRAAGRPRFPVLDARPAHGRRRGLGARVEPLLRGVRSMRCAAGRRLAVVLGRRAASVVAARDRGVPGGMQELLPGRVHRRVENLIAVLVDINFEGKDFQVFGSCQITDDVLDAAAKAALNATNRFVELASR